MLNQFDLIQIKRVNNIHYLSAPKGQAPNPNGVWSIVGFVKTDVLAAKDGAIVRVPVTDVVKVASYSTEHIIDQVKYAGRTHNTIDMVKYFNEEYSMPMGKIQNVMKKYNIPSRAENETQKNAIKEQFERVMEEEI